MDNAKPLTEPRKSFETLQYARAAAALLVIGAHLGQPVERLVHIGNWPSVFDSGVDIFFVISGFIMWMTTCANPISPKQFMAKRLMRIVPLYWIVTSFFVVVLLLAPHLFYSGKFDFAHVVESYLFIPAVHPSMSDIMRPVLVQGWTLEYEMFFYAIFALCLFLPPPPRLWAAVSALVIFTLIGQFTNKMTVFGYYTDSIILEFGYGLLLGAAVSSGRRLPLWIAYGALTIGALGLLFLSGARDAGILPRSIAWGVPALFIVGGAIFIERQGAAPRWPWLSLIGDASYSIYLSHSITLAVFWFLWSHGHLGANFAFVAAYIVLALIAATVGGIACYFVIERPATAFLRARFSRPRRDLAPMQPAL